MNCSHQVTTFPSFITTSSWLVSPLPFHSSNLLHQNPTRQVLLQRIWRICRWRDLRGNRCLPRGQALRPRPRLPQARLRPCPRLPRLKPQVEWIIWVYRQQSVQSVYNVQYLFYLLNKNSNYNILLVFSSVPTPKWEQSSLKSSLRKGPINMYGMNVFQILFYMFVYKYSF